MCLSFISGIDVITETLPGVLKRLLLNPFYSPGVIKDENNNFYILLSIFYG